nr:MAG TPA: hypothetical protein [Caudoviricetes sp.]
MVTTHHLFLHIKWDVLRPKSSIDFSLKKDYNITVIKREKKRPLEKLKSQR